VKHTPERWHVGAVREVLAEHAPGVLTLLDAVSRQYGREPATGMNGLLLDIAAQLAWVALLSDGEQPRAAEAILTNRGVNPRVLSRRLLRSSTVTVRRPHTDS
jgi:hypothetical protein